VRRRALEAFDVGGAHFADDTCKLFAASFEHADEDMADLALKSAAGFEGRCAAHYDKLLAVLEKRAREGRFGSTRLARAVAQLVNKSSSHATDAQQKRAATLARVVAEDTKTPALVRISCLQALHDSDPRGTAALARKLQRDPSPIVAQTARELLER
jgi:hypothetical protein